jgi:hypothetical protein
LGFKKEMISIIHPSRGRPQKAYETAMKWLDNAGCDVEYILSLDKDDTSLYNLDCNFVIGDNSSAIDAINNAAEFCKGDILLVLSDDFDCPPLWGKKILDITHGKTDWILKTPDGIQEWIITMPIMDRSYYNRFGYIYYPDYLHMFCDTELTCVADLTGRKIEGNIQFTHNHYSIGKSVKDEVSDRADKTWSQGEKLFLQRYKENFGLINPPGKITNQNYLNWIKGKL